MKMATSRIDADIEGDRISGVIALDITIDGGSRQGAALRHRRLDARHRPGPGRPAATPPPAAGARALDIGKGSVVWKRPMTLDLSATLPHDGREPDCSRCSTPDRKENKWLDRLLDLRNINGKVTIEAEPDSMVIPYAFVTSDTFDVGAKGIFGASGRQGVFYARTGKLAGVLAIDNKDKKFSVIDATGKFESYKPGGPVPGIHDAPRAELAREHAPGPVQRAARPRRQSEEAALLAVQEAAAMSHRRSRRRTPLARRRGSA